MNTFNKLSFFVSTSLFALVAGCSSSEDQLSTSTRNSALYTGTTNPKDFAIYATNSAALSDRTVVAGRAAVTAGSAGSFGHVLADGVRLSVGTFADLGATSNSDSIAYTAIFRYGVDLHNAYINNYLLDEHDAGGVKTLQFPSMPVRPRARAVFPGTVVLSVAASSTVTISSTTAYASIEVGAGAVLNLQAGDYPIESLTIHDAGRVTALGAVTVRALHRVHGGERVRLTVASGLSADDFRIEALGKNGGAGLPGSIPRALELDDDSVARVILFAPHGTIRLGKRTEVIGALVARDVFLDERAELAYQDGLAPPSNSVPLAFNDRFHATEDQPLEVEAEGVLANDLDSLYSTLTATIVAYTTNGTVAFAADGSFTYTPNENFEGEDVFVYRAIGPGGLSTTATATIVVDGTNDIPVITSFPNTSTFVGAVWNYAIQCKDPDIGDDLEYSIDGAPSGMTITGNAISFTPTSGHIGDIELEVTCADSHNASDSQHISFAVLASPAPESFVLFAKRSVQFRGTSVDGSIGVLESSTYSGPRALIGGVGVVGQVPGADLYAKSVGLQAGSRVQDIYTDNIISNAALQYGTVYDFPSMPAFPSLSTVSAGTGTLVVATNTQTTISPSQSYHTFDVDADACLFLEAGVHHVHDVDVAAGGCIAALGPIELRIAGRLYLGDYAYIGPAEGMSTGPEGVRIEVNGFNNGMDLFSLPVAVETRTQASIIGTLIAPNGTALFGWRTVGWGSFFARDIFANDNSLFFRGVDNTPPRIVSTPSLTINEGSLYGYQILVSDTPDDHHEYYLDSAPASMSVSSTGLISWTPGNSNVGSHTILVRARDAGGLEDTQSFQLTVININNAPEFESAAQTSASEDEPYLYEVEASDPDGTIPTITLIEGPAGMSLSGGSGTASLTWDPQQAHVGTHCVVLAATDGLLTVTQDFRLVVSPTNDAPVFNVTPPSTATEGELYSFQLRVTDEDPSDTHTYDFISHPAGMQISENVVEWTPDDDDLGAHEVTVRVRDAALTAVSLTFTITVSNTNDAPSFTNGPPPATAVEDEEYSFTFTAEDPDPSDVLTFSLDSGPGGAHLDGADLLWTPGDDQVGTFAFVVRVSDLMGAFALQTISIEVENENDPPVFQEIPDQAASDDQIYRYQARATDPDIGDVLEYSLVGAPEGMSIVPATGEIAWDVPEAGDHTIVVEVDDSHVQVQEEYLLEIAAVNRPPMIMNDPELHATQHELYSIVLDVWDEETTWTAHLDVAPPGMTLNAGIVSWTPGAAQVGAFSVVIRVRDSDGEIDILSFALEVANENDAPVFTTLAPETVEENRLYIYQARATDPDGDPLTYVLVEGPLHLTATPDGFVTWRPATQQIGSHEVELRVTDSHSVSTVQTWNIEVTGESCVASSAARCSALAWTHVLSREGEPLSGVTVQQNDASFGLTNELSATTLLGGALTAEHRWLFSKPGYVPVYRNKTLEPQQLTWIPSVRMAPIADLVETIPPSGGSLEREGVIELSFPNGAVSASTLVRVALLDGQTLPALLPGGWSPAAALWLEMEGPLVAGKEVAARFTLPAPLGSEDELVLVGFNEETASWVVLEEVSATNPSTSPTVEVTLGDYAGHALLVSDGDLTIPVPGQPLVYLPSSELPELLSAAGRVVPEYQMVSETIEEMTGQARVVLSHADPLPSGLVLPARLFETYVSGADINREVPSLDLGIAFYRYPPLTGAEAGSLSATFAVRPRVLVHPQDGIDVHQRLEVSTETFFDGAPIDGAGGIVSDDGVSLTIPDGAFSGSVLVSVTALPSESFLLERAQTMHAFRVDWAGPELESEFAITLDATVIPNESYVLARQELIEGRVAWTPVERFNSGSSGTLASAETGTAEERLPGIDQPGTYVLFGIDVPEYVVYGQTTDGSDPLGGTIVEVDGRPWVVRSGAAGRYSTLAYAGTVIVHGRLEGSEDNGSATGNLVAVEPDPEIQPLLLPLVITAQAPRVIRATPNGTNAPVVSAIDIFFSEPIQRSSLPENAVTVRRELDGQEVGGVFHLSNDRRSMTFLSAGPLHYSRTYLVEVSAALQDDSGASLVEPYEFEFSTVAQADEPSRARLISYAPGSQDTPCNSLPFFDKDDLGLTCVTGEPGTADPHVPVILVNDESGMTVTTDSTESGSFISFIRASSEDLLSAVFINLNGTRTTIPLELQRFDDGSVALYQSGGVVEATNLFGPELPSFELLVEPNSIPRRSVFKMTAVEAGETLELAGEVAPDPAIGTLLFGATIEYDGPPLTQPADVRFPIDLDELGLTELQAQQAGFLLTQIRHIRVNGENLVVYEVLDRMEYEDGALATHSFPLLSLLMQVLAPELAQRVENLTNPLHHLAILMTAYQPTPIAGLVVACPTRDANGVSGECEDYQERVEDLASFDPFFYALPPQGRRLPGAIVMATAGTSAEPTSNFRPGALNPGQIVAIADHLGRYSLALPVLNNVPYELRAIHSDFPGAAAFTGVDFGRFSLIGGAAFAHLIFDHEHPLDLADSGPSISISHSPARPAPWVAIGPNTAPETHQRALVRLTARDDVSVPFDHDLSVYDIVALVPGASVSASDVHIGSPVFTDVAAERRRVATFEVTCEVPALVRFSASVRAGTMSAQLTYPIYFSGTPPDAPNEEPAPEPNDNVGPKVDRSWPPQNAIAVQSGATIALSFNEPISRAVLSNPAALQIFPDAGDPALFLSPDQRTLEISYPALNSASRTDYSLVLTSVVTDLSGNGLDQNPATAPADGYTLNFQTAQVDTTLIPSGASRTGVPPELGIGSGSVVHGSYAFVADRTNGVIRIYDISDPYRPVAHGVLDLPGGYPRDLVLIPNYSFVRPMQSCVTGAPWHEVPWNQGFENTYGVITSGCMRRNRSLLAVVGGLYNPRFHTQGGSGAGYAGYNNIGAAQGQYLRIFDVTEVYDMFSVDVVASSFVSIEPTASVGRLKWSPPALSYIEWSSQISSINVVNLQEYIFGMHMTRAHFDALLQLEQSDERVGTNTPGTDLNGDGDYVDPNELLPMPAAAIGGSSGLGFAGKVLQATPSRTSQMIQAYDFSGSRMFLASLLSPGHLRNDLGVVGPASPEVPAEYQTLAVDGVPQGHERDTVYPFGPSVVSLDAVAYFPDIRLITQQGVTDDLVVAGVQVDIGTGSRDLRNRLFLLDVSEEDSAPFVVGPIEGIELPPSAGAIQTIELDPLFSSTLRVFASDAIVSLDINRLTMPAPPAGLMHPSITGVARDVGSTHSAHGTSNFGVHVLSDVKRIRFTGPQLHFVSFPESEAVVSPRALVLSNPTLPGDVDTLESVFSGLQRETDLRPVRLKDGNAFSSEVVPGAPGSHFHVLMYAPGGAGEEVDLLLESLNDSGHPLPNRQVGFAPVRAAREETLRASDQLPNAGMNSIRSLKAVRLSDNPSSAYYNVYLSDPIAFVYEKVTAADLNTLRTLNGEPREIYHSGHAVRVSVDAPPANRSVLREFASRVDPNSKQILLGNAVQASTFPGHRIVGPNPGPIGGSVRAPGTQDMVAVHNGELQLDKVDFELPGRSMPIELERHYTGQDLFHGGFGPGWDFNLNQRLVELKAANVPSGMEIAVVDRGSPTRDTIGRSRDVLFYNGEGDTISFSRYASGIPDEFATDPLILQLGWIDDAESWYLPEAGVFEALVRFRTGQFARLTADGMQYWYTPLGRLEKIYHRYEINRIDLIYNERGELRTVVDRSVAAPRYLEFGYYRAAQEDLFEAGLDEIASRTGFLNRIARIRDYTGQRDCLYFYDAEGRLNDVRFPEVRSPGPDGFQGRRSIQYIWEPRGRGISGVVDGSDVGASAFGAAVDAQEVVSRGNGAEGSVEVDVRHGNQAGDLASGHAQTVVTKDDGGESTYTFNERGQPTNLVESTDLSGGTERTGYSYEDNLLIKRITFPRLNWIEYVYDTENANLRSRGNVVKIRRSGGRVDDLYAERILSYDGRYNQLSGTQEDFEENEITVTTQNGGRDVYKTIYANAVESTTVRDASTGELRSEISEDGVVQTFDYHATTGFLVKTGLGDVETDYTYIGCVGGAWGLPCRAAPPLSAEVLFDYNEMGQQTSITKGAYVVSIGHTRNGDPKRIRRLVHEATSHEEERSYDQQGALTTRTEIAAELGGDAADLVWRYDRDSQRRLKDIISPSGETESFTYDQKDRVRSRTLGQYVESYGYDENGNLTTITIGNAVERRHYDGFDRLKRIEHAAGGETIIGYNKNDHVIATRVTNQSPGAEDLRNYVVAEVDELGRPREWTEAGDQYVAAYHPVEPLSTVVTLPGGGTHRSTHDTGGRPAFEVVEDSTDAQYSRQFVPDAEGRVSLIRSTEGDDGVLYSSELRYNNLGYLAEELDSFGDPRSTYVTRLDGVRTAVSTHPTGSTHNQLTTQTPHTARGEPTSRITPSGVATEVAYDQLRRISSIGLAENAQRRFGYENHRLISQTESDNNVRHYNDPDARNKPTSIAFLDGTIDAEYDRAGRLTLQNIAFAGYSDTETFTYDTLDRVRSASSGRIRSSLVYNARGVMTRGSLTVGDQYRWSVTPDANGERATLTYPAPGPTVTYSRSGFGRLKSIGVASGDPIVSEIKYATTAELPSRVVAGPVERADTYDDRQRLMSRKYTVGGESRAELRYTYDGADRETARQYLHRAARADIFEYDEDSRIESAELGARLQSAECDGCGLEWTPKTGDVPGVWQPGFYARTYTYDASDEDRVVQVATQSWTGETPPKTVANMFGADDLGHVSTIDSLTRARDAFGNTTRTELLRGPGDLKFDGLSRLREVTTHDGAIIRYAYRADGPLASRTVICGGAADCEDGSFVYVYDGLLLLAEYEVSASPELRSLYYYDEEEDVPVAADFWDGTTMRRHYFVTDRVGSVIGVLDAQGAWVERVHYDLWGRPRIESADTQGPRLSTIVEDNGDLLLVFTEAVLPAAIIPTSGLATALGELSEAFSVIDTDTSLEIDGVFRLEEEASGYTKGSVVRFTPASAIVPSTSVEVTVVAQKMVDSWSNANAIDSMEIITGAAPPTGPPQQVVVPLERSFVGNSLLFQAHLYDYDADLLLMRARVFDPHTGLFLQLDPEGYVDSPNLYAGLGHDTVNHRDPTGTSFISKAVSAVRKVSRKMNKALKPMKGRVAKAPTRAVSKKATKRADDAVGSSSQSTSKSRYSAPEQVGEGPFNVRVGRAYRTGRGVELGPKGSAHNLNMTVRREGKVVNKWREVSGEMTPEQKAIGFPRGSLSSHTEAKGATRFDFQEGDVVDMVGTQAPCGPSCARNILPGLQQKGVKVRYRWREGGRTQKWEGSDF